MDRHQEVHGQQKNPEIPSRNNGQNALQIHRLRLSFLRLEPIFIISEDFLLSRQAGGCDLQIEP